ncbi:hypothetical protein Syun_029891 [Stephania yunnanensis]|uniref:PHD-type zinc finger plants domain-containing protein n=1 Tax=Stephania yunnanensis TaxID=152371 RepID=A0AAP0EAY6_9MAGN
MCVFYARLLRYSPLFFMLNNIFFRLLIDTINDGDCFCFFSLVADTTTTTNNNNECCMCGDHGLQHELLQCRLCRFRSQHRYFSNLYPKAESHQICNWCLKKESASSTTSEEEEMIDNSYLISSSSHNNNCKLDKENNNNNNNNNDIKIMAFFTTIYFVVDIACVNLRKINV